MDSLPRIPPTLSEPLKSQINRLQSRIIKANYNTQFVQIASQLAEFRHATTGLIDEMDADVLSETFRKTVQFTSYDSYAPFVARFLKRPCKASAVTDLFVPGLPDVLVESSSTSGGLAKAFVRYNCLLEAKSSDVDVRVVSDPSQRRTKVKVWSLGFDELVVEDEHNHPISKIYKTTASAIYQRVELHLDPERDRERMGTFVLDHTAPFAANFIKKWRSFLLIHALFALCSRAVETMDMPFINTFVDMIRHLDTEFDTAVDCIANGTIPDLEGVAEVRQYLEGNISPDPERAAELRRLGPPSTLPGWCGHVWPNLRSVTCIASGSFATSLPLAQWFLGPNAAVHSWLYGASEAIIAAPIDPLDLNHFKLIISEIVEFLGIDKGDSIGALTQPWEVEQGRRYEPVVTTHNGLWRYRLGDVVEVSGFDPIDGAPILQFVERRSATIRFPNFMITEGELRAIVSSVCADMLDSIVEWTATIDDWCIPATIGIFIELTSERVVDLALVPGRLLDELCRSNENIDLATTQGKFCKPTIRLVRSGTFSKFLQLKLDEGSNNIGQVKIPAFLPKTAYVNWFSAQVLQEL